MRISRRPKKEQIKINYFYNEGIKSPRLMVIDGNDGNLGEMATAEGIRRAREQGLDLVEINPKSEPPVARIMDFGQFRYQKEKEMRLRKAHQHVIDIKGIRLSLRIGQHDRDIRKNQTLKFLNDGDKVRLELVLRGREQQQGVLATEMIKKFIADVVLEVQIRWEQEIERQGNKVTAIITKA